MLFKLHLILARKPSVFMQIRCNFPNISYLSETQKNTFQFLNEKILESSILISRIDERVMCRKVMFLLF